MAFTTLISTDALALHLTDRAFVIADCRYNLDNEAWGAQEYAERHIPGAQYVHLGHDLAGTKTGTNGRHPLPDPEALTRTFGRLGIAAGVQVVAYDQDTGMFASRLWWLLRWMGHEAVAVLDGGFRKWAEERRSTASGNYARPRQRFTGTARRDMTVDAIDVTVLVHRRVTLLIYARATRALTL